MLLLLLLFLLLAHHEDPSSSRRVSSLVARTGAWAVVELKWPEQLRNHSLAVAGKSGFASAQARSIYIYFKFSLLTSALSNFP